MLQRFEETNIVVNYKDLVCAKKTIHFLGYEIGLIDGQPGFRKSGTKIIRYLEFNSDVKNFADVAVIMHKLRFLSNSIRLQNFRRELEKLLESKPKSLKELKKINLSPEESQKVCFIAKEAAIVAQTDLLTFRSFKRELFTAIISDASEEAFAAILCQLPEEDFHKDPFDKDFVVLDVIHHKFTRSEMSRHISVKELIAIHSMLNLHREEILFSRKPVLAFTDNQGNQLRFDSFFKETGKALEKTTRMALDIRSAGIKLVHVPGIFNILADELSRKDVERIEAPVFTLEDLEDNVTPKGEILVTTRLNHRKEPFEKQRISLPVLSNSIRKRFHTPNDSALILPVKRIKIRI